MWTVVYIASNEATAEVVKEFLLGEGFLATVRQASGLTDPAFEVLVPETEAEEANEVIAVARCTGGK